MNVLQRKNWNRYLGTSPRISTNEANDTFVDNIDKIKASHDLPSLLYRKVDFTEF